MCCEIATARALDTACIFGFRLVAMYMYDACSRAVMWGSKVILLGLQMYGALYLYMECSIMECSIYKWCTAFINGVRYSIWSAPFISGVLYL